MYTIGIDFGTLSGRAVLVDTQNGREVAASVYDYPHAVIDTTLPKTNQTLPLDWALQNPLDYLEVIRQTVPNIMSESGISPSDIKGLAIDFTACTMMPVTQDGTALCSLQQWAAKPHAWVKLWKHHAAQPHADRINQVAEELGEPWLERYGGKISSEWFFAKALQILEEAPDVYNATDKFIEASDWVIWQLTGKETRSSCTAGYKAMFQDGKYPSSEYFATLNPDFETVLQKVDGELAPLGARAGGLTAEWAQATGLPEGIAIAVANIDAHVTAAAVNAVDAGTMVMIMGTSTCHVMSGETIHNVEGMCGVVDGGIIPGLYGYEAGQSGVGDIFAWFVDHAVPQEYYDLAEKAELTIHDYLEQEASKQSVGEHGLLALDWWNGNRSTLVDVDLSGTLVGMTLTTKAPDIYRALIESTAFGTREIIEAFESQGVPVKALVAAGGLPEKNALLRQIYADVTGRTLKLAGSAQAPALGSAMHAAVAADIYPNIKAAAEKMAKLKNEVVTPIPENQAIYDQLFAEYKRLYAYFGKGENNVMKTLKRLRNDAKRS